jgi:hypothetical protein
MKYLVLIVAVVVLGWLGFTRYLANSEATVGNMNAPRTRCSPRGTGANDVRALFLPCCRPAASQRPDV